jgi:hypothetical protein
MARSRKISELEAMCRWQSDQEEAELRHSSADLRRVINQSIQRFRERISDNGHPYYLTSFSSQLTPGNATDVNGQKLAWGVVDLQSVNPEVVRIYGFDITVNAVNEELDAVEFRERNHYQFGNNENTIPVAFFGYNETKIGVLPPPDKGYPFTLWYLPKLEELLEDNDEFNPGLPGAEEWIVWDVMVKLLSRDNYPRLIAFAQAERDMLMVDILARASKHQRTGPPKRIDSRGRTRNKRWYFYRHWWVPSSS